VVQAGSTSYTTTCTTTQNLSVYVAVHPEVLIVVSSNQTTTITTSLTQTVTTCS